MRRLASIAMVVSTVLLLTTAIIKLLTVDIAIYVSKMIDLGQKYVRIRSAEVWLARRCSRDISALTQFKRYRPPAPVRVPRGPASKPRVRSRRQLSERPVKAA